MSRPVFRFEGIVGQRLLIESLIREFRGAAVRKRWLAILIFGNPGSGKTTMARVLAKIAGGILHMKFWLDDGTSIVQYIEGRI